MATDFWASSHYKRWIVDRATVQQARAEDLQYVEDPDYLDFFSIFFANAIAKLGKRLHFRQRVVATATVFFRRFYLKNSYCETDPFVVIAACCYLAAKAEESPSHIKNVLSEARSLFSQETYGVKFFPSDNSKLAEMEFYLVDDLECDLTVFHPYRTLLALCKKESSDDIRAEAGEVGLGIDDGPRYWGTGEGQLELQEGALQLAWFIINDSYRSNLCLLYPPHLIAIAALYLTLVLHGPTRDSIQQQIQSQSQSQQTTSVSQPRRSSRQASNSSVSGGASQKKSAHDIIGFFAGLNVSMSLIATIAQEMISLYTLWSRYREDPSTDSAKSSFQSNSSSHGQSSSSPLSATTHASSKRRAQSVFSHCGSLNGSSHSNGGSPKDARSDVDVQEGESVVTPALLMHVLIRMRECKWLDTQQAAGRGTAVNKMLERTLAAG